MKVWFSYGSEHSANLVIIGTFKSEDSAQRVVQLLDELTKAAKRDEEHGQLVGGHVPNRLTDSVFETMKRQNFHSFGYADAEQLLYDFDVQHNGSKVVITTDEMSIEAFLKVFLHEQSKIEIYSAHDYPSQHGRPTYTPEAQP